MAETTRQVFKIHINAPIQHVWDTLTKQGEVLPFFFGNVLHTTGLAPGAPIRMRSPNGKYTGVIGDVLELDPPHRYSHTFKFTNLDDPHCKVTYELAEADGGVDFTLISEDIPKGTKTEKYMAQGGNFITRTFKAVAENSRMPFSSRFILFMIWLQGPFAPKICQSRLWPLQAGQTEALTDETATKAG